jgi:hypothetical protein
VYAVTERAGRLESTVDYVRRTAISAHDIEHYGVSIALRHVTQNT